MSPRAWVPPPPGSDDPHLCHCQVAWFNPRMYAECERCRAAYVQALKTVRLVFPGARIVGTPGIPLTTAGEGPAGVRRNMTDTSRPLCDPIVYEGRTYHVTEQRSNIWGNWVALDARDLDVPSERFSVLLADPVAIKVAAVILRSQITTASDPLYIDIPECQDLLRVLGEHGPAFTSVLEAILGTGIEAES